MKYDAIFLLHRGAEALAARNDGGTAYALYELANNLRLLMRGDVTLEQWNSVYVGQDRDAVDINKVLPPPKESDWIDPDDCEEFP
jgi:hypothetical protein